MFLGPGLPTVTLMLNLLQDHLSPRDVENRRVLAPLQCTKMSVTNLTCSHCQKVFQTRTKLQRHRSQVVDRTHACPFCPKVCSERSNLKRHIKIHTGERPHQCPECPDNFTTVWSLNAHMRRHTGEKPFKCENCSQTFPQMSSLQRHSDYVNFVLKLQRHIGSIRSHS